MIFIREATEADAEGIARVHVESWKSTYRGLVPDAYLDSLALSTRTEDFQKWFREPAGRFLIGALKEKERLVGFVSGGPEREKKEPGEGELYAIYLLKEHQGKGIGRKLFVACLDKLRGLGYHRMVLYSLKENPSRGFYTALGGVLEPCTRNIQIGGMDFGLLKYSWKL